MTWQRVPYIFERGAHLVFSLFWARPVQWNKSEAISATTCHHIPCVTPFQSLTTKARYRQGLKRTTRTRCRSDFFHSPLLFWASKMTLPKLQSAVRGGLTFRRLAMAGARRLRAIPHKIAYQLQAGSGSTNHQALISYKDRHAGERAFILGNGPSLAETDLAPLRAEVTFGLNRIYLLFDQSEFRPTYYVSIDELVLEQSKRAILDLPMPRFVNWRQRRLFEGTIGDVLYLWESYRPRFSTDLTQGLWGGATVTYAALQVAYWMGFDEVVLVGVDHRYHAQGTPHAEQRVPGPDRDHFDPRYYSGGDRWHLPDVETAELAYLMARRAFEADGRRILDATIDGNLQVFPKVKYESFFH